eukprot:GEMP01070130.1.p1 GENE.GEMP01070130.1~~GEMP01070130.1.p1  ORF type:complete len:115 (+),score=28.37 GEMP01070130.1:173-517(+)
MGAIVACCIERDKSEKEEVQSTESDDDRSMSISRTSSFSNVPSVASEDERRILLTAFCRKASATMPCVVKFAQEQGLWGKPSLSTDSTTDTLPDTDSDGKPHPSTPASLTADIE